MRLFPCVCAYRWCVLAKFSDEDVLIHARSRWRTVPRSGKRCTPARLMEQRCAQRFAGEEGGGDLQHGHCQDVQALGLGLAGPATELGHQAAVGDQVLDAAGSRADGTASSRHSIIRMWGSSRFEPRTGSWASRRNQEATKSPASVSEVNASATREKRWRRVQATEGPTPRQDGDARISRRAGA